MAVSVELASGDLARVNADVLALFIGENAPTKNPWLLALDRALGGGLVTHVKQADFTGKADQMLDVPTFGRLKARRILLVGAGKGIDAPRARNMVAASVRSAMALGARNVALALPEDTDFRAVGEGATLGAYRFAKYFTGSRRPKTELKRVLVLTPGRSGAREKKALALGKAVAEAVCLARDAVNEPPNELVPETLAQLARRIAREHRFKIKVLDARGIRAAGMHLHYAVGQGSANPPRFIHMSYLPRRKKKKLVFVGKGLTFDSGGLCIKPAPGMGDMKTDMGGAAAVLGLMAAVGRLRPDVEVHAIVGAAENMPDGSAYRPADVFTSLDGKTVEIINTDAEGRLVLADALAYAARLEPDLIVDAATLTGAALVALGKTTSAFYATSDELAEALEGAAREAGESFWRMPLLDELAEQLKSDVADLKHTGDRYGGSILGALFLREFVGGKPWIHCDVAGPVYAERARGAYPKGATGHAVLTFLRLVESFAT
ncbi:MAG TPA: leucyl aminopeptidase [Polyangiaceae bacterium]